MPHNSKNITKLLHSHKEINEQHFVSVQRVFVVDCDAVCVEAYTHTPTKHQIHRKAENLIMCKVKRLPELSSLTGVHELHMKILWLTA